MARTCRPEERTHWTKSDAFYYLDRDQRTALEEIENLEQQRRDLDNQITAVVMTLRQPRTRWGRVVSWASIGSALGISKQAAQKRYDRRLKISSD